MASVTFARTELSNILIVFKENFTDPSFRFIDFFNSVLDQYHGEILRVEYQYLEEPYDYFVTIEFLTELDEFLFKLTWM